MKLPEFLWSDKFGGILLTGHRIALEHVVHCIHDGLSAEQIVDEYPTLQLERVRQVLEFYSANKAEVDAYVAACDAEIERQRATARRGPSLDELKQRLEIRQRMKSIRQAEAL